MTRDDIIRMAKEAGFYDHEIPSIKISIIECLAYSAFAAGALAEREACVKVCNDISKDSRGDWKNGAMECEEAIRARGLHGMNRAAEKNGEPL